MWRLKMARGGRHGLKIAPAGRPTAHHARVSDAARRRRRRRHLGPHDGVMHVHERETGNEYATILGAGTVPGTGHAGPPSLSRLLREMLPETGHRTPMAEAAFSQLYSPPARAQAKRPPSVFGPKTDGGLLARPASPCRRRGEVRTGPRRSKIHRPDISAKKKKKPPRRRPRPRPPSPRL